jgi:hypothetical protein
MRWPSDLPDPIRRRILGVWSAANGATSVHERAKALTALGQLQRNHELSDVALNFIAESELQQPSRDVPKNIPNIVVLIFELIRLVGIVTSLEIALTSAFWLLHTRWCRPMHRAVNDPGARPTPARASGYHQLRKCTTPWWRLEPTRTLRNRPHSRCLRKAFSLNWCLENQMKAIRGAAAWETSACAPERCRPASSLARSLLAGNKCP